MQDVLSRPEGKGFARERLGWLDAIAIGVTCLLLLFQTWFRSRGTIFWGDEIMSWIVLRQDTWSHMFHLWSGGIDSSGLFFLLFSRLWIGVFGATLLSIRYFSATCVCVSFVLTWLCVRRFYKFMVAATVLPLVFIGSRTLTWQLANGRTYGLFIAAAALTCYAILRTDPREPDANSAWPTLLVLISFTLLVGSQLLGAVYWTAFFMSFVVRDLHFKLFRPRHYVAALCGLLVLPVSWGSIAGTAALGKQSFWVPVPSSVYLLEGAAVYSRPLLGELCLLIALFILGFAMQRRKGVDQPLLNPGRFSVYAVIAGLAVADVGMFAISRAGTSIFADRYLLPILIGDALLACELMSRVWQMFSIPRVAQVALLVLSLAPIAERYHMDVARAENIFPWTDYTKPLLAAIPKGEPVIVLATGDFVEMTFYHNDDRQFLTPIDWQVELDPANHARDASGMHQMENFKKFGLYSSQIQTTGELLAQKHSFIVLATDADFLWLKRRVLDNPDYTATELPGIYRLNETVHIWSVVPR